MSTINSFKHTGTIGKLIMLIGFLVLIPIIVIPFYPDEYIYIFSFIIPSLITIFVGYLLSRPKNYADLNFHWQYTMQKGSLTVLFAWGFGIFLGSIPFIMSNQLNIIQAIFESVSGWTTTGLSVMDVSVTPQIFIFYRAFMQFCGGLGFILVMILLVQGHLSMSLFNAEGHPDKLMPNLKKTARLILIIYLSFLIFGTLLYSIFGMPLFDAITHTMCALSTGGFSNKLNSIGEYKSLSIEIVTVFLMIVGTTNFSVLMLVYKRKFREATRVSEVKFMFFLLAIIIPIVTFSLAIDMDLGFIEGFRHALFNVTTALSTSGFSTLNYANLPPLSLGILIVLMIIGGGAGSTAGGMKMSRIYILLRASLINLKKRFSSKRKITNAYFIKPNGRTLIDNELIFDTLGFFISYLVIYLIGAFTLTLTAKASLSDAMFEFASALGTVGLSIGITNMETNSATLIVEMIGMILGRLEIFIVLIGFYSIFEIIRQKVKFLKIKTL